MSLRNPNLNLSDENLGPQALLDVGRIRRLEEQLQCPSEVSARFFDRRSLAGDIEFRTERDIRVIFPLDQGANLSCLNLWEMHTAGAG